jgi:protein phosphatase
MLVVADGMGGHSHGALASATAVQAMLRLYSRGRPRAPGVTLTQFVRSAHSRLRDRASSKGATNMGTTLTVLWVIDYEAWWVHVGDSRLYHLRGGTMTQLTQDQVRAEFARRDGRAMPSQPHALSQSFIFGSRGLGHDDNIRLDVGIDTGHLTLEAGDQFLLCSDGLSGAIGPEQMATILAHPPRSTATQTADLLARKAMAAGTTDNVTAMVLRVAKAPAIEDGTQWNLFADAPTVPQFRPSSRRDDTDPA